MIIEHSGTPMKKHIIITSHVFFLNNVISPQCRYNGDHRDIMTIQSYCNGDAMQIVMCTTTIYCNILSVVHQVVIAI